MTLPLWCLLAAAAGTAMESVKPIWFLLPLCLVVSLTYAATRREHLIDIVKHSLRLVAIIVLFMVAGYVFLSVLASYL